MTFNALVVGASSAIAQAVITQLASQTDCQRIFTVSRQPLNFYAKKVTPLLCGYEEPEIEDICRILRPFAKHITRIIICNGTLHNDTVQPEKKLQDIHSAQLSHLYYTNTIVPMLWLSRLAPLFSDASEVKVAIFSARIGSISDNKMGGWYSYRASKAALNMLIQTSAIEYARCAPNVKLIAFHPGTTDTPLSKPFQRSVPKDKLFTPSFVAERLLSVMDQAQIDQKAAYLDWENQPIDW